jgi:hypothetical protein
MEVKMIKNQTGKATITTILIIVIICYGAFVAYKFISAKLTRTQIKNEVINKFGILRGPDFSEEQGQKFVRDILIANGILSNDPTVKSEDEESGEYYDDVEEVRTTDVRGKKVIYSVRLNENRSKITFYIQYEYLVDLLIFEVTQVHDIKEEMLNYN